MGHRRLLIVSVVVVSGCTTCKPEHILQLTAQGGSSFKTSSYDKNAEDLFLYNEHGSLWLKPCVSNYRVSRGSICATIFSPPERTVSLQSAEVRFVPDGGGTPRTIVIPRITFLASCTSSSKDTLPCQPEIRGVKSPTRPTLTQSYNYQGRWVFLYEVSLDPLAELPGGHSLDTSFRRLIAYEPYALDALPYWFPIEEDSLATGGILFLPSINVGGVVVEPPAVKLAPTVAEVCTRPPI